MIILKVFWQREFFRAFLVLTTILFIMSCQQTPTKQETEAYVNMINEQRAESYTALIDSTESRFNAEERARFLVNKPSYFSPDPAYNVDAVFVLDTTTPVFEMATTTDRKPNYRIYGYFTFSINDTLVKLTAYQNYDQRNHPEYSRYLFVPFKDNTNEFGTYGGGRYVEMLMPSGENAKIDFNTAFNPYCAYNERWSCPLVPMINHIDVSILAGEKAYK